MAGKGAAGFLGWVTLAVAVLTCASVVYAITQSPRVVSNKEMYDRRTALDPVMGRKVDLGSHSGKLIVVAMGDCASCSIHSADFDQLKGFGEKNIIGVYMPGAQLENIAEKYSWIELVMDDAELHSRLNAFYSPRCYAFDKSGSLIAVQLPNEKLDAFAARLRKLL